MPVQVRENDRTVVEYNGYMYYRVEDKKGNFLFGFHVAADEADVFFVLPKVSFNKEEKKIVVRSSI